jgi:hypothetical protein
MAWQRTRRQHPLHDGSCDLAWVSSRRAAEAKRYVARDSVMNKPLFLICFFAGAMVSPRKLP